MENKKHVIIRPYNQAMINQVELWLESLSEEGWILVEHNFWKFVFEKTSKKTKYFICPLFDTSKGFYHTYHSALIKYGKAKHKSKLNKNCNDIFEVDSNKIDPSFEYYKNARNDFCTKHYLWLTIFITVLMSFSAVIVTIADSQYFLHAIIPWILPLAYTLFSLLILINRKKPK